MSAVPSLGRPRTVDEVAAYLKVSKYTVRRRIKDGALQCVRDGRMVRVTDEQLAAYLDRGSSAVVPPAPKPARNPKYAARTAA